MSVATNLEERYPYAHRDAALIKGALIRAGVDVLLARGDRCFAIIDARDRDVVSDPDPNKPMRFRWVVRIVPEEPVAYCQVSAQALGGNKFCRREELPFYLLTFVARIKETIRIQEDAERNGLRHSWANIPPVGKP